MLGVSVKQLPSGPWGKGYGRILSPVLCNQFVWPQQKLGVKFSDLFRASDTCRKGHMWSLSECLLIKSRSTSSEQSSRHGHWLQTHTLFQNKILTIQQGDSYYFKHLRPVMTLLYLKFEIQPWEWWRTDGCYQVHYLPSSRSIINLPLLPGD